MIIRLGNSLLTVILHLLLMSLCVRRDLLLSDLLLHGLVLGVRHTSERIDHLLVRALLVMSQLRLILKLFVLFLFLDPFMLLDKLLSAS